MKPFIIIAFCGILAVYGQSSNETVIEVVNNGNSTEIASVEVPDASVAAVVEPIESKQTVSLQSAEKPVIKADDDNSKLVSNAVDSTNTAIKDASDSIANAAESAKNNVNAAADTVSRQAAEMRKSAENGVNTVIENGSPSTFIASSLVLLFAFINSIQYL
jgi:hypothetical protein